MALSVIAEPQQLGGLGQLVPSSHGEKNILYIISQRKSRFRSPFYFIRHFRCYYRLQEIKKYNKDVASKFIQHPSTCYNVQIRSNT